ncbi:ABC transporter ATP-binding protein [Actinomadura sp. ATCC 31491]|uniref:ABC transporter ATP-binding protein n=1 Tax=Actinomadura luzonensis TaxID=2805427 RepID=A0ABT0FJG2_9ACTN|nr:ABC transporter ATP-binding protein [Actinomadura luzonensis]MCK2212453.1 ABC transporter ATP-binding protein [Actinomadura luzonensis]
MTLLRAERVTLGYGGRPVVHDVSLDIVAGGVGLIGESGSGKTTLARAFLGLLTPMSGNIWYGDQTLKKADMRTFRKDVQPVFQAEALDPRMRIGASVAEALPRAERSRVGELLEQVGLDPELAGRRPHQLSGGQRQRVVIARALAVGPRLLILDEPTSALDVTVQARILDLLAGLDTERLLITHNLAVVERLCRTSHVLFAGRVVESGPTAELLARPAHPYTRALRDAVPRLGGPPPAANGRTEAVPAATGCPYRLRCPLAAPQCERPPALRELAGRQVACHRAEDVLT